MELATRTLAERNKQDEVRSSGPPPGTGAGTKRKAPGANISPQCARGGPGGHSGPGQGPGHGGPKGPPRPKKQRMTHPSQQRRSSSPSPNSRRKEKLYCICRTPYDDTKYVT